MKNLKAASGPEPRPSKPLGDLIKGYVPPKPAAPPPSTPPSGATPKKS